jgi:hypothetical protein
LAAGCGDNASPTPPTDPSTATSLAPSLSPPAASSSSPPAASASSAPDADGFQVTDVTSERMLREADGGRPYGYRQIHPVASNDLVKDVCGTEPESSQLLDRAQVSMSFRITDLPYEGLDGEVVETLSLYRPAGAAAYL